VDGGKKKLLICDNCKKEYDEESLSDIKKRAIENSGWKTRTPLFHFTGLFIILLSLVSFAAYIGYSYEQDKEELNSYYSNPVLGDYYIIEDEPSDISGGNIVKNHKGNEKYEFYVFKLIRIENTTYYFNLVKYVYTSSYSAQRSIDNNFVNNDKYFFLEKDSVFDKKVLDRLAQKHRLKIYRFELN